MVSVKTTKYLIVDGENVGPLSDSIGVCVCTNASSKAQEGELMRKLQALGIDTYSGMCWVNDAGGISSHGGCAISETRPTNADWQLIEILNSRSPKNVRSD